MNRLHLLKTLAFTLVAGIAPAQQNTTDDRILMTVGDEKVTVSEFMSVYQKNPSVKDSENKSIQEYIELYTNFRLKVKEARDLGMDTSASFRNELMGYRKQLSMPYLTDTVVNDKLLKEVYERMQWDIRSSHILIKCDPNALPKDTLAAYNAAMKAYNRIKAGEDFAKVCKQVTQDDYGKTNGGDLDYRTVFELIYPFETAMYNMKVGEVSKPVRSQVGYHIIKVTDRQPHIELTTAHIMIKTPKGMSAEDSLKALQKINDIYDQLVKGTPWDTLAMKYSDDPGSAKKGGLLPPVARNYNSNYPAEFKTAAFTLGKDGEYTKPFKTRFGWHIVKRVSSKGVPPFADVKNEIKNKVSKDPRANTGRTALMGKIKTWYNFKEDLKARDEFYALFAKDSSIFKGQWKAEKAKNMNKVMFSLLDKNYTQADFAKYIESHQAPRPSASHILVVNGLYKAWQEEALIAFEDSRLEMKYPKFKALMQEYNDGILLFELTDKKVWSKGVKDTAGLRAYYELNKTRFMWDERAEVKTYTCANEKVAAAVRKMIAKGKSDKEILEKVNKNGAQNLSIETKIYNKGDNKEVDARWAPGLLSDKTEEGKVTLTYISKLVAPTPKSFSEAKGLITADYQAFLEKEWIDTLKKKYKVVINEDVLKTLK
ncbi:MAG: peptidylprolyl isomerase [Bacteroidota bacterium]